MRNLTLTALVFLVACGGDDDSAAPADAGPMMDTSIRIGPDGGDAEAGSPDAAPEQDAIAPLVDASEHMECPGVCDPVSGMCETGVFCVLGGQEPACVDEVGALPMGMPCEEPGQCQAGLSCFRTATGGVCAPICCPTSEDGADACLEGTRCSGPALLVDGTETSFGRCVQPRPDCDVLDTETCSPGEACYIVSSDGEVDCRSMGQADVGEPCDEVNDCMPGLSCAGFFERVCARVCELNDESSCPMKEGECQEYAQTPEGTGLCTPESMMQQRAR